MHRSTASGNACNELVNAPQWPMDVADLELVAFAAALPVDTSTTRGRGSADDAEAMLWLDVFVSLLEGQDAAPSRGLCTSAPPAANAGTGLRHVAPPPRRTAPPVTARHAGTISTAKTSDGWECHTPAFIPLPPALRAQRKPGAVCPVAVALGLHVAPGSQIPAHTSHNPRGAASRTPRGRPGRARKSPNRYTATPACQGPRKKFRRHSEAGTKSAAARAPKKRRKGTCKCTKTAANVSSTPLPVSPPRTSPAEDSKGATGSAGEEPGVPDATSHIEALRASPVLLSTHEGRHYRVQHPSTVPMVPQPSLATPFPLTPASVHHGRGLQRHLSSAV